MLEGFKYLLNGGPIMYPLFACAILAVAVMIERFIVITRAARDNEGLSVQVLEFVQKGQVSEALQLCESTPGPVPALLADASKFVTGTVLAVDGGFCV
jgi:biopolymer transport protein ExbB